jgi:hypothetical protein
MELVITAKTKILLTKEQTLLLIDTLQAPLQATVVDKRG